MEEQQHTSVAGGDVQVGAQGIIYDVVFVWPAARRNDVVELCGASKKLRHEWRGCRIARELTVPKLLLVLEVVGDLKRHADVANADRRADASFDRRASCGGAGSSAVSCTE